uniref:Uncharacterized protein n=1 Tax=Vespula pensylvanica TaxID=30213 RepID=A0A834P232_VESPE|nr:hypothetical protein H0235_007512 [Vespula pensylvanica]
MNSFKLIGLQHDLRDNPIKVSSNARCYAGSEALHGDGKGRLTQRWYQKYRADGEQLDPLFEPSKISTVPSPTSRKTVGWRRPSEFDSQADTRRDELGYSEWLVETDTFENFSFFFERRKRKLLVVERYKDLRYLEEFASCSGTAAVGRGVGDGRAQGRTSDWSKAEEPQVKIQVTGENFCVGVDRRCATRTLRFSLFEIDLRASTIEGYAWTELDCVLDVWFAPIYSTVTLRKGHILPGAMIVPC